VEEIMAEFELRVKFTGLNLFLAHKDLVQVAVLQPDCQNGADMAHQDGSNGVPHVGFLKFDLANLEPAAANDVLRGQGVYRFKQQTLDFGLGDDGPISVPTDFPLPDFALFAPNLTVRSDLFSASPSPLLMRVILRSGAIKDPFGNTARAMPQVLNPRPAAYERQFRDDVTWIRTVKDDHVTLTIRSFAGADVARVTLKPVAGVVALTIANLCSDNPLQWPEFGFDQVASDDEDFKWLYRLLLHPDGTFKKVLLGSPFPIPRLVQDGPVGTENCIGGILRGQTF
jgi:hypothetical protein